MKHMEINCETNQVEIKDFDANQIKQQKIDNEKSVVYLAEVNAEKNLKAVEKSALFAKLGITAEEAALLLG